MGLLKCEVCSGTLSPVDEKGIATCENCGTRYMLRAIKEMYARLSGEPNDASEAAVNLTNTPEDVERWRIVLDKYLTKADFVHAEELITKILEASPEDEQANLLLANIEGWKASEIKDGVLVKYNGDNKEVYISKFVKKIGNSAFSDDIFLTSVIIGGDIESIGKSAFSGCKNIYKINIPKSVVSIGEYAFNGCVNLAEVTFEGRVKGSATAFSRGV